MVNLNDVQVGDILTFKGRVVSVTHSDGWRNGRIKAEGLGFVYFNSDGEAMYNVEVVGHKPKAFDEPTGLGAVVRIVERTTGNERIAVKTSENLWVLNMPSYPLRWGTLIKNYRVVEVVNEGVEL